jgi:ankyrin repeat protein
MQELKEEIVNYFEITKYFTVNNMKIIIENNLQLLDKILTYYPNVFKLTPELTSLIFLYSNNLNVINKLCYNRCDLDNLRDTCDMTLLHYACISGNLEVVKTLLDNCNISYITNANIESGLRYTPIYYAVKHNRHECVKYLLNNTDIDLNKKYFINSEKNQTLLEIAQENSDYDMINILIPPVIK